MLPEMEAEEPEFKPWTAAQAQQWRAANKPFSVWWLLWAQVLAGVLVAGLAWLFTRRIEVLWSAGYGSLAVVLPFALFARGVLRHKAADGLGASVMAFAVWEAVKIGLTIAMLWLAPRWVPGLNWPALLVALVVTVKVHWLALAFTRGAARW